jgi:hypothetical protein
VLNLHESYARAPDTLLSAFAVIVTEARHRGSAFRAAREQVSGWGGVLAALREAPWRPAGCAATPGQRIYLQRLYRYFNATRFEGRLPHGVPVRLSARFTRRLGQMVPGHDGGRRVVREVALSLDLMLPENDGLRADTLLHEMAHAIHYLDDGGLNHGPQWRAWARRVGCEPRACRTGTVLRRERSEPLRRVPALPEGWRAAARAS